MDNLSLSKDADALICLIYKHYLQKRSEGTSKSNAKFLGDINNIHSIAQKLNWSIADLEDTCRELSRAGVLTCHFADNTIYAAYLSDEGIIYLENRFKSGVKTLLDYLSKIVPFVI